MIKIAIYTKKNDELELPILEDTFSYDLNTVPVYELDDIHITPYDMVKQVSESIDLDIPLTISLLEETNDIDNLYVLINESDTLLEDLDEYTPYIVNPISEDDTEYQFVEECVDNYIHTLDESYIDILLEEENTKTSTFGKAKSALGNLNLKTARETVLRYLQNAKSKTGSKAGALMGFAGISAKDADPIVNDLLDMVKNGNFDPSKIDSLKDHGRALYNKFVDLAHNPEKVVKAGKNMYKAYQYGQKASKQLNPDNSKWEQVKGMGNAARAAFYTHKAAYGKGTLGTLNKMDNEYLHGGGKIGLATIGAGAAIYANRKKIAKRIAALRRLYDKKKHSKNIPSKVLWRIKDLINRLVEKLQNMKRSK